MIENEREWLDSLRVLCGMGRLGRPGRSAFGYEALVRTEWSPRFEGLMRNRLIMGALRYGVLHDPGKPPWDRLGRIARELEAFRGDRNKERLVDIANMCLLEFEEGHGAFAAADDGDGHTVVCGAMESQI